MIIPSDLNDIQPRATQVWNCDEVGFDPNGIWSKVIYTYKFFQGKQMWKVQNGEQAPFWCMLHFTRYGGKCFMPPIIVRQSKDYSQDIHYNVPVDWIVHHAPSGYMDRDGWLKSMTQFSNVYGASPVINKILSFDGHDSHFEDGTLRQMICKNIQPFVLKSGDSINDQPNDNGPNTKLKYLYNVAKSAWILKYGGKNFTSPNEIRLG